MEIHFLGVGEACDSSQPNTSILVRTSVAEKTGRILLDCGFSAPHHYFALNPQPEELEVVWISHFHGDHFLGIPLLILWFWEMRRQKPLDILGPPGVEAAITKALELGYPSLPGRLGFSLAFHEAAPGAKRQFPGTVWQTAYTEHSQPCLALRLEMQGKALFYSGDGRPTLMTQALARGCDIMIHEAYGLDDTTPGHGSIKTCLAFAHEISARRLALVHIQRDFRPQSLAVVASLQQAYSAIEIMVPEKGSTITI